MATFTPVTTEAVSEEYRAELLRVQQTRTLSEEAGEFRQYLVREGVVEEAVKVLIGLFDAEEGVRPEDGRAFLRAYFDSKQLDPFVTTSPVMELDKLIDANQDLKEEHATLSKDVKELTEIFEDLQIYQWQSSLTHLFKAFPVPKPEEGEGGEEDQPREFDLRAARAFARSALVATDPKAAEALADDDEDDEGGESLPCPESLLTEWAMGEFGGVTADLQTSFQGFVRMLVPGAAGDGEAPEAAPEEGSEEDKVPPGPAAEPEAVVGFLRQLATRVQTAAAAAGAADDDDDEDGEGRAEEDGEYEGE